MSKVSYKKQRGYILNVGTMSKVSYKKHRDYISNIGPCQMFHIRNTGITYQILDHVTGFIPNSRAHYCQLLVVNENLKTSIGILSVF